MTERCFKVSVVEIQTNGANDKFVFIILNDYIEVRVSHLFKK